MRGERVTVFGGSGFIGRAIVRALTQKGAMVTVGCTDVEAAKSLKTMGLPPSRDCKSRYFKQGRGHAGVNGRRSRCQLGRSAGTARAA